jgi:glycosyltransferase involved in cell wall biosynthesis
MAWLPNWRNERKFSNREEQREYDFTLRRSHDTPGVSALVRVRNEAPKIGYCLRSILPFFDEIVLVDNGSDDGTADIVRDIIAREDGDRKIRLHSYPHRLARFGPEHDATAETSLHSAVYYSNWALSHCSRRFVCKWDGDMVLNREVRVAFADFLRRIQSGWRKRWTLAGQTVYRGLDGSYYLAIGEVNREVEVFPYGHRCSFTKRRHWEYLTHPITVRKGDFAPVAFYELKFVDADEFDHWSTREWPSERKRREWRNYHLVKAGQTDPSRFQRMTPTFLDSEVQ